MIGLLIFSRLNFFHFLLFICSKAAFWAFLALVVLECNTVFPDKQHVASVRCFTNTPWFLLHVVPASLSGNWSWWVKMFANVGIVIFIVVVPSSPTTSVELNTHPRCEDDFGIMVVTLPKKLRCWKRGHAKRKCVSSNHQFSGDFQYVNWGGFGWKVSRKSSYQSPKFDGWSRWKYCAVRICSKTQHLSDQCFFSPKRWV